MAEIRLNELLEKSRLTKPSSVVVDKNNCLGSWKDELQKSSDKIKFEKCKEQSQTGYCCDAHPGCTGCPYNLPDEVYVKLGGKLLR